MKNSTDKSGKLLYTIGHSNISIGEFLALLQAFHIELVADIRQFPSSRRYPHFNQKPLEDTLAENGVEYRWFQGLGGRRHSSVKDSPNTGLRVEGFRNYADYMMSPAFHEAVAELTEAASSKTTAVMCAEKLYWKCHRRILSDYLLAQNFEIIHIIDLRNTKIHKLSEGALITSDKQVLYPPAPEPNTLFPD